jgi:hypothetical protein
LLQQISKNVARNEPTATVRIFQPKAGGLRVPNEMNEMEAPALGANPPAQTPDRRSIFHDDIQQTAMY